MDIMAIREEIMRLPQEYKLTGRKTGLIYSEQEMADALGLTQAQLRHELVSGNLSYHAHPSAIENREYQFLSDTYESNLKEWECIQSGGHYYSWSWYAEYRKLICTDCGKERYD